MRRILACLALIAACSLPAHVEARVKSVVATSCTNKHFQDMKDDPARQARYNQCSQKIANDIANGLPDAKQHYLICTISGGMSCCQDRGNSGARSCDPIVASQGAGAAGPLTGTLDPGAGTSGATGAGTITGGFGTHLQKGGTAPSSP
jgi:hypothetical protein